MIVWPQVLRLICIQSICNDGLKPKVLEFYKREIVQTYGFEHLVTLNNLERCGMLRPHGARTYQVIRKSLKLIVEEVNEQVGINYMKKKKKNKGRKEAANKQTNKQI
jgi:hypothetical protein